MNDRIVCITGASQGIGRGIANSLSEEGYKVINLDIKAPETTEGFETIELDIGDSYCCSDTLEEVGQRFGCIDVLINCASIFSTLSMKPFWEIEIEEWESVIKVNLTGTFNTCKAAFPWLKRSRCPRIINFSSAVVPMGRPNYLHYVSSKAGVQGMTRAMAREVGDFGITVNAILPGATVTEVPRDTVSPEQMQAMINSRCLKRPQNVDDLSGIISFLCSDRSGFITGQSFVIDGGIVFN
jgi:3-oxoacyl-[acyl-carrier protein] reductase